MYARTVIFIREKGRAQNLLSAKFKVQSEGELRFDNVMRNYNFVISFFAL